MTTGDFFNPDEETLDTSELQRLQRRKLVELLSQVHCSNAFYKRKFAGIPFDPLADPLSKLPLTLRNELELDQRAHPPHGSNLTAPLSAYCRFHQTSGSSGQPMRWLDTADSWNWCKKCWGIIFRAAGLQSDERLGFPFSFGPFLGFWAAFDGAIALGNLCIPAGGMTTIARLKLFLDNQVNVICCTPTYALRMAEVAQQENIDLRSSPVRALIVAGEPGGSVPEIRSRIEQSWGARVFDHTGMTEIGPLGFECSQNPGGVHLIESECIPEVIDPSTGAVLPDGQTGELVITNLGRIACPLIRYRTGDQVRLSREKCSCGRSFARMEGGILGRLDDMFIVRGNNVFPAAIEAIIRRFAEVAEFRVEAYDQGTLTQVRIDLEPLPSANGHDLIERVTRALQETLSFRADVRTVLPGSLPRFEMKARRFVKRTGDSNGINKTP
jgi:phenylacetate-CoA ligase